LDLDQNKNFQAHKGQIASIIKNGKKIKYIYNCVKCGNCCRAGFDILIDKEDIENWIKLKKKFFLQHIQIDPKCISQTGLAGYHIEEVNTLKQIKEIYGEEHFDKKVKELTDFILENHNYLGKGIPLPVYTILPELERMPILVPKTFQKVLEGLEWGLVYMIKLNLSGYCPFLKENLCTIHKIKPKVCKSFPYDNKGNLKVDNYSLKICKGFKQISD
jgi:Fe-S-cluster containining protein